MTSARRGAALLPWLIGAWVCLASARHLPFAESQVSPVMLSENDGGLGRGQALVYGVPLPRLAWSMPGGPLIEAALFLDAPRWLRAAGLAALSLTAIAVTLSLGLQLGSLWVGAAVLLASRSTGFEMELFALLVALLAAFLAEDARRPAPWKSAAIGLAIGVSLLVRSELFLLPPLLAALRARRGRWREALLVAAIPVLLLAPWAAMNRRVEGRLIPLEDRRADNDVVAGALGFTETMEGDYRSLAAVPDGEPTLAWAAGEVARHPLRFAGACAARLFFVARRWPLVVISALLGFLLLRREPAVRGLFPLAAYYLLVHSLLPVEMRYVAPIRPVLAAVGAALALRAWKGEGAAAAPPSLWPALAALGAFCVLAAVAEGLVWAYPGRALRPAALDRALERHPGDAWLWWRRGAARLSAGDAAGALEDLRRARQLKPELDIQLDYAWALDALGRDPGPALAGSSGQSPLERERVQLLLALHDLELGDEAAAARRWRLAWSLWSQADCFVRGGDARASQATFRLRGIDTRLLNAQTRDLLAAWPADRRRSIIEALVRVFDRPDSFPREDARRSFRWAAVDLLDSREMASVYGLEGKGEAGQARRVLDTVLARNPRVARFWSDRGVLDAMLGRRAEAARDLSKAILLDADFLPAYATLASVYLSDGRPALARDVYEKALSKAPAPRFQELWETMRRDRRGR